MIIVWPLPGDSLGVQFGYVVGGVYVAGSIAMEESIGVNGSRRNAGRACRSQASRVVGGDGYEGNELESNARNSFNRWKS